MIHQRRKFTLVEKQLHGSGGWINADITDEQAKNADLGVGKLFIAKIEKLGLEQMKKHFCKTCDSEFDGPTKIQVEEAENEAISDELILVERGQYTCHKCNSIIAEYRVFLKNE
jgi:hypothetical protein